MMRMRRFPLAVRRWLNLIFAAAPALLLAVLAVGSARAQQAPTPAPNLQPFQPFQPDNAPAAAPKKEPEIRRALPVNPNDPTPSVSGDAAPVARPVTSAADTSAITVLPPASTPTAAVGSPVSPVPAITSGGVSPAPARTAPRPAVSTTATASSSARRAAPTPARSAYPAPGADVPGDDPNASSPATATVQQTPAPAPRRVSAAGMNAAAVDAGSAGAGAGAAAPDQTPTLAQRRAVSPRPPTETTPAAVDAGSASPAATADADSSGDIRLAPQASGSTAPDEAQFTLANYYYRQKQFAQAAAEYERYLGKYPSAGKRQDALWWLGECYRNLNRSSAARTSYQNLIIEYTDGEFVGPANFRLATIDFADKDYSTALPLFQRSATLAKTDDVKLSSRYFEALCLENLNRRDETREVYEDILTITTNNPYRDDARLALARLAVAQKHPSDAFKQYEALSREATKPALKADSAFKAGLLAREIGQYDTAATLLSGVGAMPGATADMRADAQLALLHLFYDTNKYQRLIESYPAAKRDLPDTAQAEALLLLANSQRQLGKHAEAQSLYAQLIAQYPRSPFVAEARYQRVISLYASGGADFVSEADGYLNSNPPAVKADQVRLMKADTLFKKTDYAGAAQAYAALNNGSNLPAKYKAEAAYRLGYCYAQLRQPEQTADAFTKFLKAYPEHPFAAKALVQRAVAYQQMKNYSSALADFNEVITDHREAKEREIALQQKALILGQQEDNRGMADTFRTLLKDYPKTDAAGMANFYLGRAAFDAKDYPTALAAFEAARKADPKEYGARASLSIIVCQYQLRDKAKLAKEIDAYQKDNKSTANSAAVPPEVLRWLGEQEYEEKDFADAEKYLSGAAQTAATADTWLMLARARLNLQKWDGALDASRRYLEKNTAEPAPRAVGLLVQGDAQLGLKKYDEAQKSADEALQLQPEGSLNAKARLLSGRVAFARGEYEPAGKLFMSVSVLYDDPEITPQALRQAAEAFDKAGKTTEAAKANDELKSRFPNYTAAVRQ